MLAALFLPSIARAQIEKGFPVERSGRSMAKGVTLADLDRDGKLDIIAVSGEGFVVVGGDGKTWEGYPKVLRESTDKAQNNFDNAPTVCDVDGDSRLDIVLAGTNQQLYALRSDGSYLSGFPVALDGEPKGAVACVPVKGTNAHTLALVTEAGSVLQVGYSGGRAKRIGSVARGAESGVAVSDLDGDGEMEYVVVGGDSRLVVFSADGKKDPKLNYQMAFRVSGTPSLGDIDDDGQPEIVLASQDFKVHAVRLSGESLPGFPYATGYRLYGAAALADVDRDGVLDVVVGSGDRRLHVINGKGESFPGFPAKVNGRIAAEVAVGDIDFDGKPELATVTERGALYVFDHRGKTLKGFPARLGGEKTVTAPAMGDIDGDGVPELVAQGGGGDLYAFELPKRGKAEVAVIDWGMSGHDSSGSGRYGPNPGRFKALTFSKELVFTTDDLEAKYTFFDLDGDSEGATKVRWYRNGKRVSELDDKKSVPAAMTKKHEKWRYTLQDADNFARFGEKGLLSVVFESAELEIANTPPTAPAIAFGPDGAKTTDTLSVTVTAPSTDVDGDRIVYRYSWLRDGIAESRSKGKSTVEPRYTKKGELWRVVVTPFDGEVEGASTNAVLTVQNTVPSAPQIAFNLAAPKVDDEVQVLVKKPAVDVDGDPIRYRYQYRVGEHALALPLSSNRVPPRTLHKHDRLEVLVTAWDDEAPGGSSTIGLEVANTPPVPPQHSIWPANPKTTDALVVGVRAQPADADRDAITLDYQWLLNGKPVDQPSIVPPEATKKGQKWTVRVTPRDDEVAGKTVEATTVIVNSAPIAPVIMLDRYTFTTTETVVPRIQKDAFDADGDPVSFRYEWLRGGKPSGIPTTAAQLDASATSKGQEWELVVTPNDGTTDGLPVRVSFRVENTAPVPPKVSFVNVEPTVRDNVSVRLDAPATDADGDELVYRYRWFRNDRPVPDWPPTKAVLKAFEGKKGDRWRVEVSAFDGETESTPARAELTVLNHPPDPPLVAVTRSTPEPRKVAAKGAPPKPAPLNTTDDLRCAVTKPAVDPDDDPVSYRYRWYRSEALVPTAADLEVLPATMTVKGERWSCEVEAFDGAQLSSSTRSEVVALVNAAPSAPTVSVFPDDATTADDLLCELAQPAADPDYDPLRYTYRWKVDGKDVSEKIGGNRVPASETKKGQTWRCEVSASDGELTGATAAASGAVANTAPTAPVVNLVTPAFAGEDLTCEIQQPATDVDGDRIRYGFVWVKDGVQQSFAKESNQVPGRLVKEKDLWKCEVVASDGVAEAAPAASPAVAVQAARIVEENEETRGERQKRRRRRRR